MKIIFQSSIINETDEPKGLGINLQYLHPEHLRVWHSFFWNFWKVVFRGCIAY